MLPGHICPGALHYLYAMTTSSVVWWCRRQQCGIAVRLHTAVRSRCCCCWGARESMWLITIAVATVITVCFYEANVTNTIARREGHLPANELTAAEGIVQQLPIFVCRPVHVRIRWIFIVGCVCLLSCGSHGLASDRVISDELGKVLSDVTITSESNLCGNAVYGTICHSMFVRVCVCLNNFTV